MDGEYRGLWEFSIFFNAISFIHIKINIYFYNYHIINQHKNLKKMKKFVIGCIILNTLAITSTYAQNDNRKSEEKIILQDNKPSNEVEIEIRDGNVYVDGKKVAPYALNRNLKIIKKLNKAFDNSEMPDVELHIDKKILGGDAAPDNNKAMLGVSTEPSTNNDGALVKSVNANTPAAKAGLRDGDIITKVDKTTITSPQDLVAAINNYKPGDKVSVSLKRDGKEITETVTLTAREDNGFGSNFGNPDGDEDMMGSIQQMMRRFGDFGGNPFEGMEEMGGNGNFKIYGNGIPSNNNPKLGAQVEERADGQGIRVVKVVEKSAAEKAGILAEDIITNFGGNSINSIDDLSKALADTKDKKDIVVEVMRAGKAKTLYVQIEKPLRKKEF